ncbi:MAG TPA: aldo/keto reductase [Geminicoccaceae bacterium]|nr:aldo/keto reductase [Geminicoccus sp.]HMU51973.1 aldo/keto reductase [Geminicoccaceae bacterium]
MHRVAANGADIPALGFGTWELRGATAQRLVEAALAIGYRHLDTAQMYGNEAEVGAGLRASGLRRDEVFVTTKVWPDRFRAGDFERSVEESLRRLRLDAVDLLLLHWPSREVPLAETMGALNRVHAAGKARHIGISNFTTAMIDEAVALSTALLATDQVEYHPMLSQRAVLRGCRRHGMALTAYCPLARGRVFGDPVLKRIAEAHGRGAGQVALRWLVQQEGVVAIPRSSSEEHARGNFAIFDFALGEAEMAEITAIGAPAGRVVDVAGIAPRWDAE